MYTVIMNKHDMIMNVPEHNGVTTKWCVDKSQSSYEKRQPMLLNNLMKKKWGIITCWWAKLYIKKIENTIDRVNDFVIKIL